MDGRSYRVRTAVTRVEGMTELAVRVTGLRKRYGDVTAVDGVDLRIRRGEVFGLLGPNGAGKSTTVGVLLGLRRRDGGDVRVLGRGPAAGNRRWRSRIGVVWQDESAPAELTVGETVAHFARSYPGPRDSRDVLALVGLADHADRRTAALSGGQRRRLDLAPGVIGRPELLLLDEPTTGFDPAARHRFRELVRRLAAEGTTIVLTTHDLDEAGAVSDRIAVIAQGRVVAEGDPDELRRRHGAGARVHWTGPGGRRRTEWTTDPTRTVTALSARYGGEVPGLRIVPPTLEEVYLRLTGEADRDTGADSRHEDITTGAPDAGDAP